MTKYQTKKLFFYEIKYKLFKILIFSFSHSSFEFKSQSSQTFAKTYLCKKTLVMTSSLGNGKRWKNKNSRKIFLSKNKIPLSKFFYLSQIFPSTVWKVNSKIPDAPLRCKRKSSLKTYVQIPSQNRRIMSRVAIDEVYIEFSRNSMRSVLVGLHSGLKRT